MDSSLIPPGFEAFASLYLEKMEGDQASNCESSANPSMAKNSQLGTQCNNANTSTSIRHISLIKQNQLDSSSSDQIELAQENFSRNWLPKGVLRGCEACENCQKVIAKWRPEEARRPDIEDAPVFYPSEEEFEDTIKYIASIRSKAEMYGICRIVPPPSWNPPCPLKEKNIWERSKFATRIQQLDKLQNRESIMKKFLVKHDKSKKRKCLRRGADHANGIQDTKTSDNAEQFGFEPGPDFTLDEFQKYDDDFMAQYFWKNNNSSSLRDSSSTLDEQWHPTIQEIEGEYWRMVERPTEEIEVLYGADLETGAFGSGFPKHSHQVASASETKYINSGWNLNNFPRLPGSVLAFESNEISGVVVPWLYIGMCFSSFCWHVEDHHMYSLNYMHLGAPKMWYGVPGSDAMKLEAAMRKHLPDLFEEQPDLLHKLVTQLSPSILRSEGVPVYRCVQNPGEYILTFPRAYHAGFNCGFNCAEAVNIAPVDWLPHGHKAIELYREQGRRSSISHDKLLLGAAREAVKENWQHNFLRKHKSNNLRWSEACGKDGFLSKALKTRVDMEHKWRELLSKSSKALKMESSFDANCERECSVCLFDLHLSAAGCHQCSPDKYACLTHAKQLCSCSWSAKFFLFRYDIMELNLLVEALEGKLSAVYRWAKLDMGLALTSHVAESKQVASQESAQEVISSAPSAISSEEQKRKAPKGSSSSAKYVGSIGSSKNVEPPSSAPSAISSEEQKRKAPKGSSSSAKYVGSIDSSKNVEPPSSAPSAISSEEQKRKVPRGSSSSKKYMGSIGSSKDVELPFVVLALPCVRKATRFKIKSTASKSSGKKENSLQPPSGFEVQSCQAFRPNNPAKVSPGASDKSEEKQPSLMGHKDVILLSDDEEDGPPCKKTCVVRGTVQKDTIGTQKPIFSDSMTKLDSCINKPASAATVSLPSDVCIPSSTRVKVEELTESESSVGSNPPTSSCVNISQMDTDSNKIVGRNKETNDSDEANHNPQQIDDEKVKELRSVDNMLTVSNPSSHQHNMDGLSRQKRPRIAKVIRRVGCNVEPLDFGAAHGGKLWCDSNSIYPKGFRSRVRYIDVTDPTNMCYYVSEILDAGKDRPLFMVSLETNPSEVFVHVSAGKCWELVRERVNHAIAQQHKLGKGKLPPLQPPGSVDGMQMFGFSSPAIIQACHPGYGPRSSLPRILAIAITDADSFTAQRPIDCLMGAPSAHRAVERTLDGLIQKANAEEVRALNICLHSSNLTT